MKKTAPSPTPKTSATIKTLRVRQFGKRHRGLLLAGGRIFACSLGEGGITSRKREGDGKTPSGRFQMLGVYARYDKNKKKFGQEIKSHHGWCDAVGNRNYNRLVRLPYRARAEKLKRADSLYDIFIVLDYNISQRLTRGGSAIFFHIAAKNYKATKGCVAIAKCDMQYLIKRLAKKSFMIIEN